jgi:hypothetical protein
MAPSVFNASMAAGYAGFLSTFITRGMALPDASIALRRKRLAAAVSRLAVTQKVDRLARGIQRSIQILVLTFYLDVGFVDPIALVDWLEIPAAAFVQFGCIRLHPTPNATGIYLHAAFGHQLRDVLIRQRVSKVQTHAFNDQFSRVLAPFEWI